LAVFGLLGPTLFAAFAVGAFTVAFLTATFFRAPVLAATACVVFVAPADSARFSAQRFFVAATIAALPARLSFRLGFGASGVTFDVVPPQLEMERAFCR